jgi:hypothetical protein
VQTQNLQKHNRWYGIIPRHMVLKLWDQIARGSPRPFLGTEFIPASKVPNRTPPNPIIILPMLCAAQPTNEFGSVWKLSMSFNSSVSLVIRAYAVFFDRSA